MDKILGFRQALSEAGHSQSQPNHLHQSPPMSEKQFPSLMPLPLLQAVIDEAENNIQAPRPLIITAALTAISVVLQGLFDVKKPSGGCVPLSLMILVVANSGERKSTVENVFLSPIRKFQQQQHIVCQEAKEQWQAEYDVWEIRKKAILKSVKNKASQGLPVQEEQQQLKEHQKLQPIKPKEFKLLYVDSTSEALFHGLHQNISTAGLISSEGGGVLNSGAFKDLPKMNSIWSGDEITVDRKSVESYNLIDARLTVSIMAQESAISAYMKRHGEQSRGSGLWARFLVCHPTSTQGSRFVGNGTQSWEHSEKYAERITELLKQNLPLLEGSSHKKQVIQFTTEAAVRWLQVATNIEEEIKGGEFEGAGDHASKLADNIARVAALLHCFEGLDGDISIGTLTVAIDVCGYCSNDFLALFMPPPQEQADAAMLDAWFSKRVQGGGPRYLVKRKIRQYGPSELRDIKRLNCALEVLCSQGRISMVPIGNSEGVDLTPRLAQTLHPGYPVQSMHPVLPMQSAQPAYSVQSEEPVQPMGSVQLKESTVWSMIELVYGKS